MQYHELHPNIRRKPKKRIGRGGKKGTYSGKGGKGQTARAGSKAEPRIRRLLKRYPKLRGTRASIKRYDVFCVSVATLEKKFEQGALVNPQSLSDKKIISPMHGRIPAVKILSGGTLTKALTVEKCVLSAAAKEKIEKAGGNVKEAV